MFKVMVVFEGGKAHDAITTRVLITIWVSALDTVAARELATVVIDRAAHCLGNCTQRAAITRDTLGASVWHREIR